MQQRTNQGDINNVYRMVSKGKNRNRDGTKKNCSQVNFCIRSYKGDHCFPTREGDSDCACKAMGGTEEMSRMITIFPNTRVRKGQA